MNPYADMYPDEWTPPCPKEEQAAEEWLEHFTDQEELHDA